VAGGRLKVWERNLYAWPKGKNPDLVQNAATCILQIKNPISKLFFAGTINRPGRFYEERVGEKRLICIEKQGWEAKKDGQPTNFFPFMRVAPMRPHLTLQPPISEPPSRDVPPRLLCFHDADWTAAKGRSDLFLVVTSCAFSSPSPFRVLFRLGAPSV
jgi:hypothetical protein